MDVNKVPVSGTVESGTLDVPVLDASWVMRLEKRLASIEERLENVEPGVMIQDESPNAVGGNISYKYREPPASESTGVPTLHDIRVMAGADSPPINYAKPPLKFPEAAKPWGEEGPINFESTNSATSKPPLKFPEEDV